MTLNELKSALSFYKIEDENYIKKCTDCLDVIEKDSELRKRFFELNNTLFVLKKGVKSFWSVKTAEALFLKGAPAFSANLLLLSGYKEHQRAMEKRGFDEGQIALHKMRVKGCLTNDVFERKLDGMRVSQLVWGAYFINANIIEVGRLQFELTNESNIDIHIPADGKLDIEACIESVREAIPQINRYFGITDYNLICTSWLLSDEIHAMVKKESNIYKFYELFNNKPANSCVNSIIDFVFGLTGVESYELLPENTGLQRSIKAHLLSGKDILNGYGVFKKELIKSE